jgi:hypothetical protein
MWTPETDDQNLKQPVADSSAQGIGAETVEDQQPDFDDMSLADLFNVFLRAPLATSRTLLDVVRTPAKLSSSQAAVPRPASRVIPSPPLSDVMTTEPSTQAPARQSVFDNSKRNWMQLGLYFSAYILALWGCLILVSGDLRTEAVQLSMGAPFLVLGFIVWLGAEVYGDWPRIKSWQANRRQKENDNDQAIESPERAGNQWAEQVIPWGGIHPVRVFAGLGALFFAMFAWFDSVGNQFRIIGFWAWVFATVLIVIALAPIGWSPSNLKRCFDQWRAGTRLRFTWTMVALLAIMLMGAVFRFYDLAGMPPEMTSDHVEKLLDAQRVRDGDRDIFFVNNGGREGFQMYALALLSHLPGLDINYITLKLLAAIESLITLPIMFLMGREVIGERNRRLGIVVGLVLAALVAVSYWHVTISRQALRIVLTPLMAGLVVIFLSRAMRHNRRGDFILTGMALGYGLYTYQAMRMMPFVIVAGIGLAFLAHLRNVRMRREYVFNFITLVIVAFVIFVPLFRFSVDYPEAFWMRTAGRILGDDIIQEVDAAGNIVQRNATIAERLDAFWGNLPALAENIRNALLMFNWKGDVGFINGLPNHPAMDSFTGALLIVGLAAWFALMVRQRDPVHILLPIMVLIMLLPSALSIAMPLENPSATRTSGALPAAYLLAAFPLALIVMGVKRVMHSQGGTLLAVSTVVAVVLAAYAVNSRIYFVEYRTAYELSTKPYSEPGRILRGFAMSDGSYGNAFMIAYPHWWDHRAVGMEAGINDWTNGIVHREETPDFIHDTWLCVENKYRLEPDKDLLFFYSLIDDGTEARLQEWFPSGRITLFDSYQPNGDFKFYRVPALGEEGLGAFLNRYSTNPRCIR